MPLPSAALSSAEPHSAYTGSFSVNLLQATQGLGSISVALPGTYSQLHDFVFLLNSH